MTQFQIHYCALAIPPAAKKNLDQPIYFMMED